LEVLFLGLLVRLVGLLGRRLLGRFVGSGFGLRQGTVGEAKLGGLDQVGLGDFCASVEGGDGAGGAAGGQEGAGRGDAKARGEVGEGLGQVWRDGDDVLLACSARLADSAGGAEILICIESVLVVGLALSRTITLVVPAVVDVRLAVAVPLTATGAS